MQNCDGLSPLLASPQGGVAGRPTKVRHTTHQTLSAEVIIRYRFHPRAGERFRIVRRQVVHDETCFVLYSIDKPDVAAFPLAVPAWMTEESSREFGIVSTPRLPVTALVAL